MKLLDSFIHLFSGVFGNDKGPDVPSKNTSSSDEKGEENAVSADATEVGVSTLYKFVKNRRMKNDVAIM